MKLNIHLQVCSKKLYWWNWISSFPYMWGKTPIWIEHNLISIPPKWRGSLFITLITKWVWISRIRHILGTFWCSVNYIQVRNSIGRWNSPARVADIQEKFGILGRMEHRDKWQYMPKTFSLDAIFTWQTSKLLPDTSSNKKGKIHIHHFPAAFLKRRQKIFSM